MKRILIRVAVIAIAFTLTVATPVIAKGPGPGGGEEPITGNNLSFPVITVDGTAIVPVEKSLSVPYVGENAGLTEEEIFYLNENGPWYPQKTEGNSWQADHRVANMTEDKVVSFIDWGDIIESNNPKLRRPFRLEVTLYKSLTDPMTAYTMAVLENPSSSDELQGTNGTTTSSIVATMTSKKPGLRIQYAGETMPTDLEWIGYEENTYKWISDSVLEDIPITFTPELNVGGKYIFGASSGGFRPEKVGWYRITFYIPNDSTLDFNENTYIGYIPEGEEIAAEAVVDSENNITYVDVQVVSGGGGGKR